jgi:hypothetical protein
MTLPLRRKRPTTAPNTPPAKAIDVLGAWLATAARVIATRTVGGSLSACRRSSRIALVWLLVASLISGSVVRAGQVPQEAAAATKVKWQARGVRTAGSEVQPASAEPSAPLSPKSESVAPARSLSWRASGMRQAVAETVTDEPASASEPTPVVVAAPAVQAESKDTLPVDEEQPAGPALPRARRLPTPRSRAKTREAVMQVSTYQRDPLADPFNDQATESSGGGAANPANELALPAPAEPPRDESPSPNSEPPVLGPEGIPEQPLPDSSTNGEPLVPGFAPPQTGTLSCDQEKRECERAIQELRARDIRKIVPALLIQGDGGQPAVEGRDYPCECSLGTKVRFAGRDWAPLTFTWKATGVCHKPLYFEDAQLERYGHSWNPVLQPFMSAAHFFVSVPLLPYKMGLNPPNECIYSLGYYRPGDCAPYMIDPIPLSLRAAAYQALGITGFVFWFWPPVPLPANLLPSTF